MTRRAPGEDERLARFDEVFRTLYEDVRRQATRYGAGDADDVAAEVFAAMWRRFDSVAPGAERAWVYGAVRLQAANQRRTARRQTRVASAVAGLAESQPEWAMGSTASDPHVRDALERLSHLDQEILLLATWSGLGNHEIARILDVTRAAAAVRLHRAKKRFRVAYLDRVSAPHTTPCLPSGGTHAH